MSLSTDTQVILEHCWCNLQTKKKKNTLKTKFSQGGSDRPPLKMPNWASQRVQIRLPGLSLWIMTIYGWEEQLEEEDAGKSISLKQTEPV